MVRRPDVNYIFYKNNGAAATGSNDAMFFYSEGPGYLNPGATLATSGSASTMALVGFRINPNNPFYPGIPVMERLGENLTWGGLPDYHRHQSRRDGISAKSGLGALQHEGGWSPTLAGNWTYTLGNSALQCDTRRWRQSEGYEPTTKCSATWSSAWSFVSCSRAALMPFRVRGRPPSLRAPPVTRMLPRPFPPRSLSRMSRPITSPRRAYAPDLAGNVYGFPPDLGRHRGDHCRAR